MLAWWGDVGSNAKTSDTSVIGDVVGFDILPGSDDVYNSKTGKWDKLASGPNYAPNCAYLGWGIYVMARVDGDAKKHKAAWSAAAHLGGKDLSLWTAAYPSGFQPYRNSHSNIDEWVARGLRQRYITSYLKSQADSYNHPNAAIEPRIPGIFQYYSIAEDELAKIFAGKVDAHRPAPTTSPRHGRSSPTRSAATTRSSSTRLARHVRRASDVSSVGGRRTGQPPSACARTRDQDIERADLDRRSPGARAHADDAARD